MTGIEGIYRDYLDLCAGGPAPRTPSEIQTAIEAAGLHYEGVSGATFWSRLAADWLNGEQAGHPFEDTDQELNARYCDLALSRGLLREA